MSVLAGNLHFVNVVPEDSKSGATYTCVAENRVMRGFQQGEFNTIQPHGGMHSPLLTGRLSLTLTLSPNGRVLSLLLPSF